MALVALLCVLDLWLMCMRLGNVLCEVVVTICGRLPVPFSGLSRDPGTVGDRCSLSQ